MADRLPLRIVYVNGVPTIGEFQDGDTLGVEHGGTGTSSLAGLKDSLGWTLSSLYDVNIDYPGTIDNLSYGDVLTWNGSFWTNNHVPHLEYADYSGAPYNISSISFLTNLGSITLQEGEIAWDGTASTIQVQTDASTTQLAVLQVSSASNDGDILLWDGTNGYYYPTSAFVDVSSQVDTNTSALENTLDASDLSVELSAISTELSAISIELSSIVSSIHLSGLGDVSFTDLSADQHLNWDGTNWINADNDRTEMRVRNGTASPMSRGDLIAIESAHNQNLVNVILADASQTSAMPALGILKDDLAVGAEGIAITFGKAGGLNTSGLTEGATAYVSPTTPGTITETKPTDTSHLIQNIGIIMRAHASNGAIKVTGIGRANDIDNQTRDTLQYVNGTTVMPASNSNFSAMPAWTEGTHNQGSYWLNVSWATPEESIREYRPDPFNGSSILWIARDTDITGGYDGGFETSNVSIDASYTHRISGFVKQYTPTSGTNQFSFGPMHNFLSDPTKAVAVGSTGTLETNPRFGSFHDLPTYDEWYLVVGHVQASSTSIPATKNENTGIWDLEGNQISTSYNDFVFSSTATQMGNRFHHYNNPNGTGDEMEFFGPRIDRLDGNEPSIKDLLKLFTTQHGQLDGLDQNDHPQYVLSSTNSALSSTVTSKVNKELVGHYIEPWEEGSGNQNAPIGWTTNGVSSLREFDTNPFGDQSIIWKAIDVLSGLAGEGGFNSGKAPADSSSLHRFSCFIKQENPASGTVYFGPYAYSSLDPGVTFHQVNIRASNAPSGTGTTNKYFIGNQPMPSSDWYLAVAYLLPYQTETGPVNRQDTALYKVSTGEKVSFHIYDYMLDDPTAIGLAIRAYHYNNPAGTGDTVQFFQPRIDIVDGNEPSIADLLRIVPRTDCVLSGVPTMTEGGVSVTGVGACPHPQPFWYGQTTTDATASRSYDWGSAATETEVVCDDHFNWDSANSRLYVSSTGIYEVDVMFMIDGGSDFTAEVIVKVDGTGKNTTTHDYVSANSPSEYSGRWVGKIEAGSYITATFRDAAVVVSTSHEAGSTMIVKRLA